MRYAVGAKLYLMLLISVSMLSMLFLLQMLLPLSLFSLLLFPGARPSELTSINCDLRYCFPLWDLSDHTCETLELEAFFPPFATWLPWLIKTPNSNINCSLVFSMTKFVNGRCVCSIGAARVVDITLRRVRKWLEREATEHSVDKRERGGNNYNEVIYLQSSLLFGTWLVSDSGNVIC